MSPAASTVIVLSDPGELRGVAEATRLERRREHLLEARGIDSGDVYPHRRGRDLRLDDLRHLGLHAERQHHHGYRQDLKP